MPRPKLEGVTAVLRERIRDASGIGAMKAGDKLPGTRRLAAELQVDPRLISLALRRLQQERIVEIRPRSGAYVAAEMALERGGRWLPAQWATEAIAQAVERGFPPQALVEGVAHATDTHKVRAAVVAATSDQAVGMVRELQDDYDIAAAAVFPEQLASPPRALIRAHLVLTTGDLEGAVKKATEKLFQKLLIVRIRPDLFTEDWIAFMNGPVFVVCADPRFRAMLRQVIQRVPGSANVTIMLASDPEVSRIPRDGRKYVTESARRMLGSSGLSGPIIRPRRLFSSETVREIVAFLVARNASKPVR